MIWFACKQCNKVHGRAEGSIGTTVFCECGQGNIVPWESTAKEPEKAPETPAPREASGAGPRLKPIVFESSPPPLPAGERAERRPPERKDERAAPYSPPEPQGRRERRGPRDPNACLNHDNKVKQNSCADCQEGFCSTCLVTFQGKMLCGPCKNYRLKLLQKPLIIAPFAWLSAILVLALGPLAYCLPIGTSSWSLLWTFLALVPQAAAIFVGYLAWSQVEKEPGLGGRSLALTGMVGGGVTVFLLLLLNFYGSRIG